MIWLLYSCLAIKNSVTKMLKTKKTGTITKEEIHEHQVGAPSKVFVLIFQMVPPCQQWGTVPSSREPNPSDHHHQAWQAQTSGSRCAPPRRCPCSSDPRRSFLIATTDLATPARTPETYVEIANGPDRSALKPHRFCSGQRKISRIVCYDHLSGQARRSKVSK